MRAGNSPRTLPVPTCMLGIVADVFTPKFVVSNQKPLEKTSEIDILLA